jgi:hypothetical protein
LLDGFVGCADGPERLSGSRYKQLLGDVLCGSRDHRHDMGLRPRYVLIATVMQ